MISLITGPMCSGKTTELLRRLERAHRGGRGTVLLRPPTDTRPSICRSCSPPDWLRIEQVELSDFNPTECNTIGIDEGQFHRDLVDFCVKWNRMGVYKIIISALHSTSECEMFDEIVRVVPYCEEIVKLNSVCSICGSDWGSFSFFKGGENKIDNGDNYLSLCFKCYTLQKRMKKINGKERMELPEESVC